MSTHGLLPSGSGDIDDLGGCVPLAYAQLDRSGVVREISQAGCQLLAIPISHILDRPFLAFVAKEHRSTFLEHVRRCGATQSVVETELVLQARDGSRVPILMRSKRSSARRGGLCWTLFIDLRERQRLEGAREEAERERRRARHDEQTARASSEAKDRFLAMLSHELRTPLTPALFAARRLLDRDVPKPVKQLAAVIVRNIEMEARLIDDLLDVTRIARGRLQLRLQAVDVHEVLRDLVEMCSSSAATTAAFEMNLEAGSHVVSGDDARLRQVFRNLLVNAAKFGEGGRVEVRSANDESGALRVSIHDSGIGMDDETLARLFAPFEHQTSTASRDGLGLGLAICKGIIEAHEGRIWARSPGRGYGSTFEIELRTLAPDFQSSSVDSPHIDDTIRVPVPAARRVLLVEDDPDTAAMLSLILKNDGHQVAVATSLCDAIVHAGGSWDVVISDLGLPDGSGLDLPRHITETGRRPRMIALSGYGSEKDASDSSRAGFDEHLVKPLDVNRLREALSK